MAPGQHGIESQFGPEQTHQACGPGQGLTVRRPGRGLTVFCRWFVFYLMASLVFKNRNPKSVKLAEKASNDRVRETTRERERETDGKKHTFSSQVNCKHGRNCCQAKQKAKHSGYKRAY